LIVNVPPAGTAVWLLTAMELISGGVFAEACPVYTCFSAWYPSRRQPPVKVFSQTPPKSFSRP
jgi:hypothetical protein